MTSYKERAELIKALSEDQYFKARLNKDESESVRIGDRDGRTGRYQVLRQDGGITNNGIKTFNQAAPQDGFVRVLGNGSGGIALDHRNRKREERRRVVAEEPLLITPIKFIQGANSATLEQIYIGGDRPEPELIFTQPSGYVTSDAYLTTLGTGQDEWILQTISTKKAILDRLLLSTTIDIYLEDPTLFVNGQIFQTTTANSSISFYSSGNLLADGTVYTGQKFLVSFVLSEIQSGIPTELGLISVEDTYNTTSTGVWSYARTARVVNFTGINTALDPTGFNVVRLNAESILTSISSNAISWRSPSDAGLSNPFSGYSLRVGGSVQIPSIPSGEFAQNDFKVNQLRSILFGLVFGSPNNSFKMRNGWFFNKDGIYSKSPEKWLGAYASFNTPSNTGFVIPWNPLNFSSNSATQSISLPISPSRNALITASTASIQYVSQGNINNDSPPPPNGGTYKPLDLIQGWNQETQLVKVGSDWRLYLSDGTYTVVKIPTYNGSSFLNLPSSFPDSVSLVGDALFAVLSGGIDNQQLVLVGAQLKTTDQNITTAKVTPIYAKNDALGQIKNIDIYLTLDDYEALEDYAV